MACGALGGGSGSGPAIPKPANPAHGDHDLRRRTLRSTGWSAAQVVATAGLFRILALLVFTRSLIGGSDILLDLHGRPDGRFVADLVQMLLVAVGVTVGLHTGGLTGAACAVVVASFSTLLIKGLTLRCLAALPADSHAAVT